MHKMQFNSAEVGTAVKFKIDVDGKRQPKGKVLDVLSAATAVEIQTNPL